MARGPTARFKLRQARQPDKNGSCNCQAEADHCELESQTGTADQLREKLRHVPQPHAGYADGYRRNERQVITQFEAELESAFGLRIGE